MANGFANRYLWFCVRRQRVLPFPEEIDQAVREKLVSRLRQAVSIARIRTEMQMSKHEETLAACISFVVRGSSGPPRRGDFESGGPGYSLGYDLCTAGLLAGH